VNEEQARTLHAAFHSAASDPEEFSKLRERLLGTPLMRLVGLAGQSVGHSFRRVLAEQDGLSTGSAAVLSALAFGTSRGFEEGERGRATHSELAKRCMITPPPSPASSPRWRRPATCAASATSPIAASSGC
jgi:hypothetical protein